MAFGLGSESLVYQAQQRQREIDERKKVTNITVEHIVHEVSRLFYTTNILDVLTEDNFNKIKGAIMLSTINNVPVLDGITLVKEVAKDMLSEELFNQLNNLFNLIYKIESDEVLKVELLLEIESKFGWLAKFAGNKNPLDVNPVPKSKEEDPNLEGDQVNTHVPNVDLSRNPSLDRATPGIIITDLTALKPEPVEVEETNYPKKPKGGKGLK